jgi:opacity protein-like surface antigen
MIRILSFCVTFCLLGAATARAQSWELSGLAGYVPATELEQQSLSVDGVAVGDGFMFSFQGARFFTPHWGVEASFSQQFSSYDITVRGETGPLFSFDIAQLHADVVYEFGATGARLRPFVLAGAGAAFFSSADLPVETKLSAGVGGGIKFFLSEFVGLRAQVRYRPVFLDADGDDFCDPFGFCQSSLQRFDVAAGVSLRF